MADLENIHTRKGKYPTKSPPLGQATWEDAKREKEERLRKAKKERPLSTPLETTSTDAMDTEEAQEFNREIVAKDTEKELRKQRYSQYQQKRQQIIGYDFPRPGSIQVPQLEKLKKRGSLGLNLCCLILAHPIMKKYPCTVRDHLPGQGPSQNFTPLEPNKERETQGARPKIPSSRISAFQDYTSDMMRALNNPWVPKGRKTTTPSWTEVAPLAYLSSHGTPIEGQPMGMEDNRNQVGINMSTLGNTELVPENMSQIKNPTSPTKFTERLLNGAALKVEPQETNLLKTLGFDAQEGGELELDLYMPGKGSKLIVSHYMYTTEKTPEDSPGVLVKLDNLEKNMGHPSIC